jgi:alpha-amylase
MKNICLHFQVHQPFRLRQYRFFDIGLDSYYYDEFSIKSSLQQTAKKTYLPMNELLLDLIKKHKGAFKVSFSISGSAIEQFEMYAPEILESFQKLAKTNKVEFTAQPYSSSLVSVKSEDEFKRQVDLHSEKIKDTFGKTPKVFHNTHTIYSDFIGEQVANMGFDGILTEGAKQILGWKSPNFVYCNANTPKLKVLLRNYKMSDDISLRFNHQSWDQWPITAGKIAGWIKEFPKDEEVLNLFMDYETFGVHQKKETGIFDFMATLPDAILKHTDYTFATPSDVIKNVQPVSVLSVPNVISNTDEERDLSAWLGNNLQREAFDALYSLVDDIANIDNESIQRDWVRLQNSDNFYFMSTKFFADGNEPLTANPYPTPYEAFINYMNVLADFAERVKKAPKNDEYVSLSKEEINVEIAKHTAALEQLIELKAQGGKNKPVAKKAPAKKATTKKAAPKKTDAKKTTKKPATKKQRQKRQNKQRNSIYKFN